MGIAIETIRALLALVREAVKCKHDKPATLRSATATMSAQRYCTRCGALESSGQWLRPALTMSMDCQWPDDLQVAEPGERFVSVPSDDETRH